MMRSRAARTSQSLLTRQRRPQNCQLDQNHWHSSREALNSQCVAGTKVNHMDVEAHRTTTRLRNSGCCRNRRGSSAPLQSLRSDLYSLSAKIPTPETSLRPAHNYHVVSENPHKYSTTPSQPSQLSSNLHRLDTHSHQLYRPDIAVPSCGGNFGFRRAFHTTHATAMVAQRLDGTAIAKEIREKIGAEILEKQKVNPRYKPSLKIIQGA